MLVRLFFIFSTFLFIGNIFAAEVAATGKDGAAIVNTVISTAKKDLSNRKVKSRAYPLREVVRTVRSPIIHRLLVVENTSKKDLVTNGPNDLYRHIEKYGMKKLSDKKSGAGAGGVMQITEGAHSYVKALYPNAGVNGSFQKTARDPVQSAKVAILFVDSSLAALEPYERRKVMKDDNLLHDYIATAYNGGINYAKKTLQKGKDFTLLSKVETRNYVEKMRQARILIPV